MSDRDQIHHVQKDGSPKESACGRREVSMWGLMTREHAQACVTQGTLVRPCLRCCKALGIDTTGVVR